MSRSLKVPVGYHYGNSPLMVSDVFFTMPILKVVVPGEPPTILEGIYKARDLICIRETQLNLPVIPMQNILVFTSKKPRCFLDFFSSCDDETISARVCGGF